MKEVVETALDLGLPIACTPRLSRFEVLRRSRSRSMSLRKTRCRKERPKLLASGKVSYKGKVRQEASRAISAIRRRCRASVRVETMLHLPTCAQVHVSVMVTDLTLPRGEPIAVRCSSSV